MKKYVLDLQVSAVEHPNSKYTLIKLTDKEPLPQMLPGQFVEVRVDGSPTTFLRRPISINYVDRERNEMWLLVAAIGDGTRALARLKTGDTLNCVLPLGNSFTMPASQTDKVLLVGGGVGVAPLLFFGQRLKDSGITPTFLLGVRSAADLLAGAGAGIFTALIVRLRELVWTGIGLLLMKADRKCHNSNTARD